MFYYYFYFILIKLVIFGRDVTFYMTLGGDVLRPSYEWWLVMYCEHV